MLISRTRIHEWMIDWSSIHCKEASHGRNRNHHTTVDTASAFGDAATAADPARIADPRCVADPGRIATSGAGPMMNSGAGGDRASANGLPAELTAALVSLWTQYAGKAPSRARTEIRGNVVTSVLIDAVGDYNRNMIAPQTRDTVQGVGKLTPAAYRRDAVAAVVRLTRQRVTSFVSSHDRDTDVATEVFKLEPSFSRGAPSLAERRMGGDYRLFTTRLV